MISSCVSKLRCLQISGRTLFQADYRFHLYRPYLQLASNQLADPADFHRSRKRHRHKSQSRSKYRPPTISTNKYDGENRLNMSTSATLSSSSSEEVDESMVIDTSDVDESHVAMENNIGLVGETDDDLTHLRLKLYEVDDANVENDGISKYLKKLYEAASVQQVFDAIEEHEKECGKVDVKIASQALVTIWDLQKLLFKISSNFDPERDYFDRPSFIEKIAAHPIFVEKLIRTVVENCEELEDEPLTATLFCMKRINYDMRLPECEKFVDECLKRRDTLLLPALSRLFVCLRDEGLYGQVITSKFLPLLFKYVETMSSDIEVRLIAISLRNCFRLISDAMIEKFIERINELQDELPKWENVTMCKVFLFFMLSMHSNNVPGIKETFDLVGEALIPRVPTLQLMELLSLQKFLELGINQPYGLVEALVQRMMRTVQEGISTSSSPRLDLMASVAPYMKGVEQRRQMGQMLKEYLDSQFFDLATGILFSMLRWSRIKDIQLYDHFWAQAESMASKRDKENVLDRRIIRLGRDYVNFCYGLNFSYRNKKYESTMKQYLYRLIENYANGKQPGLPVPSDLAKAYGFLIGTAYLTDPILCNIGLIKILDDFGPQFRSADLALISRGVESVITHLFNVKHPPSKYYDRIIEICSILEEQSTRIIMDEECASNLNDMLAIHRITLLTRRVKGETPIVEQSMKRITNCKIRDTRAVKDLAQSLLLGMNNYPEANKAMLDVLHKFRNKPIHPEVIEKFLCAVFTMGWEPNEDVEHEVIELCSERLSQNWDKVSFLGLLQASTALSFYKRLPKELVQNIFSVEFLDQIDAELTSLYFGKQYPMRLRQSMMELNRTVCIDMPDVNLPWFHQKFCEEMLAMSSPQETYLHQEVRHALASIVGDDASVQSNICSPYYYRLDFLIEFDEKNRPIKKYPRQSSSFFQKFRESSIGQVQRKVAVLILHSSMFTRNVRNVKGLCKLRKRHLEILGYDVIEIDPMYWNSMFMSENSVRNHFLESKLYANLRAVG